MKHVTREAWLNAAINSLRPAFKKAGSPLPEKVRAAIGFTSNKKHVGECWHAENSADGAREIFMRPTYETMENPMYMFKVLAHECVHAALPTGTGHGKAFCVLGRSLLMEGKPRHLLGGEDFEAKWRVHVERLGPFPGARMTERGTRIKDRPNRARKVKVCCSACNITFRLSACHMRDEMRCLDPDCDGQLTGNAPGDDAE